MTSEVETTFQVECISLGQPLHSVFAAGLKVQPHGEKRNAASLKDPTHNMICSRALVAQLFHKFISRTKCTKGGLFQKLLYIVRSQLPAITVAKGLPNKRCFSLAYKMQREHAPVAHVACRPTDVQDSFTLVIIEFITPTPHFSPSQARSIV